MFWKAIKVFLALTVLTGVIYPLLITGIAQLTMPEQANGSRVLINGELRGSYLIAQPFEQEKYFWPRPSAIGYDPMHSGGSNLGPTSRKLKERIANEGRRLAQANNHPLSTLPSDLVYTSGSGLDPHITLESAYFQLNRIAKARNLTLEQQRSFHGKMEELIEGNQWGFLGQHYFNVLKLNLLLDQLFPVQTEV